MKIKKIKLTKKSLIISLYILVFVLLAVNYGIYFMTYDPSQLLENRNGLFFDKDGEIRYYENGEPIRAGLVQDEEGNYYYINSLLKAVKGQKYNISLNNDLLPCGEYTFDENGKLVDPPKQ